MQLPATSGRQSNSKPSEGLVTIFGDIVGQQAESHAPIGVNYLVLLDGEPDKALPQCLGGILQQAKSDAIGALLRLVGNQWKLSDEIKLSAMQ